MDDRTTRQPHVTERDREHMRRIGEWKRQSHEQARLANLALPARERIIQSLLEAAMMRNTVIAAGHDPDGAEPLGLNRKARERGLALR